MDSVLPSAMFALSRLGRLTIVSMVALAGFAAVSGIILMAVSAGVPAGWAIYGGEKTDLLDVGYGPYYSGSTERDAPGAVSILIPRQELGGNSILVTGQQIA